MTFSTSTRYASIALNDDLDWSRGKRAAHAAHAALALLDVRYTHAIRVLNARPRHLSGIDGIKLVNSSGRVVDSVSASELVVAGAMMSDDALTLHVIGKKSDSRDDTARKAIAAALAFYGMETIPVTFILKSVTEDDVMAAEVVIRDRGTTELARGTITAGASWA